MEGTESGDCDDGDDNDRDGLFDCDDDGCLGSPRCEAVDSGEDSSVEPDGSSAKDGGPDALANDA